MVRFKIKIRAGRYYLASEKLGETTSLGVFRSMAAAFDKVAQFQLEAEFPGWVFQERPISALAVTFGYRPYEVVEADGPGVYAFHSASDALVFLRARRLAEQAREERARSMATPGDAS